MIIMFKKSLLALAVSSVILVAACGTTAEKKSAVQAISSTTQQIDASAQANKKFDELFNASVMRSPMWQTYLGIKKDYDKWNDISEENTLKELAITKESLVTLQAMDTSHFDAQTKVSHTLYIQRLENEIADHQWRFHSYPVHQMRGLHSQIPAFLINQHAITNIKEARDYISRVQKSEKLLAQLVDNLKLRAARGIIAPKFVFAHVLRDANNIITGAPFTQGSASTVLADFTKKINKLTIDDATKSTLLKDINSALTTNLKPGYDAFITYVAQLEKKADSRDGVWKFPQGKAFFNNALKRTTTTDLSADEIHQIGLKEVARIHDEMRGIKNKVNFAGDLATFMAFMRSDKQFYYPATDEGKAQYLSEAVALIDDMKTRLDRLFLTKPKAELTVKAVEAFREKSAGKAFYQPPAPDGSRPGTYYANLYDMEAMPTYQMAALAYHEGIPGHHMQFAIKQELTELPMFRKFGGYTAHTEGWGLYSELLPKEIGLYQDPYSDFGRLAMELWRACRLVVDTGIHTQQWTREQGIEYYVNNTPNAKSDAVKMVERHIVMPSQATAYKVGMLKILALRKKAKVALGDKFDIREYHDVILKNGPVPLNVLEDFVNEYITSKK
jgi:uncharacterized protein (DUF885 family)